MTETYYNEIVGELILITLNVASFMYECKMNGSKSAQTIQIYLQKTSEGNIYNHKLL
jgi:hypothetical protein